MTEVPFDELTIRVAALKVTRDRLTVAYDEARAAQALRMTPGSRWMAVSPIDGTQLGAVSMSKPKPTARIANEAAFSEWAAKHYPDDVEFDFEVMGSHQEVAAVLYEHAEHLVRRISKVDPRLTKLVTSGSAEYGAPVGPNGELDVPGVVVEKRAPQVSCLPSDGALAAVIELVKHERFTLEALARPELSDGVA